MISNHRFSKATRGIVGSCITIALVACGGLPSFSVGLQSDRDGGQDATATGAGGGDPRSVGASGMDFFTVEAGGPSEAAGIGQGCASSSYAGEQMPLDIFILYDQSGSMNDRVGGGTTKWDAVKAALSQFVLAPSSAAIGVGIQYFPLCPGTTCSNPLVVGRRPPPGNLQTGSCNVADYATPDVPIAPLPMVAQAILDSLGRHAPSGSTTTSAALSAALDYAKGWAEAHLDRKVIVVLATDGAPTLCDQNIGDIANLAAAAAGGTPSVKTFVIGVGSSLASLDRIASGGGTGQALLVDTTNNPGQRFLAAINQIRGTALSCDFVIPTPNDGGKLDYAKVNVTYTPKGGSEQFLVNASAESDCDPGSLGWHYDDRTNPMKITLCPATCDAVKGTIGGTVNIVLGCETIKVIPR